MGLLERMISRKFLKGLNTHIFHILFVLTWLPYRHVDPWSIEWLMRRAHTVPCRILFQIAFASKTRGLSQMIGTGDTRGV